MNIKPGRQFNIKVKENGSTIRASVLEVKDNMFSLLLQEDPGLKEGDEIELEFSQHDDALYLMRVCVIEAGGNGVCMLEILDKPRRLQRRRFQRIPSRLPAEYIPLPEKKQGQRFQQGLILDISSGGALLCLEEPLELNSELLLTFEISLGKGGENLPTGIGGKVIREHHNPKKGEHCYGMKFNKPLVLLC